MATLRAQAERQPRFSTQRCRELSGVFVQEVVQLTDDGVKESWALGVTQPGRTSPPTRIREKATGAPSPLYETQGGRRDGERSVDGCGGKHLDEPSLEVRRGQGGTLDHGQVAQVIRFFRADENASTQ